MKVAHNVYESLTFFLLLHLGPVSTSIANSYISDEKQFISVEPQQLVVFAHGGKANSCRAFL